MRGWLRIAALVLIWFAANLLLREPTEKLPVAIDERAPLAVRVEQLKDAMARSPIDAQNMAVRGRVLADWADELSRRGIVVSAFAPAARGVPADPLTPAEIEARTAALADLYRELVAQAAPGAIGGLSVAESGPFAANSLQTLRLTYTVGTGAMARGGGFRIMADADADFGELQADDAEGNGFVSIESADGARFAHVPETADGVGVVQAPLVFRLVQGNVDAGTTVTITLAGLRMPRMASPLTPLPAVQVAVAAGEPWLGLPAPTVAISGLAATHVRGFLPSMGQRGETVTLTVRAEDRFGNRATGLVPAFDVLHKGRVVATTLAGEAAIHDVPLRHAEEATQRITLRSHDGAIIGEANPMRVVEAPAWRICWGDLRSHAGQDASASAIAEFWRFAATDARLDFAGLTTPDAALVAGTWERLQAGTAGTAAAAGLVPFLGYEWTSPSRHGGHHLVLFRNVEAGHLESVHAYPTLSRFFQAWRQRKVPRDVLLVPVADDPGDYRQSAAALESVVEIASMHGRFEWFAEAYLAHGHQVGFIASSGETRSRPGHGLPRSERLAHRGGLTAVLADACTRDAIFDALKAGRTYATSGERIVVEARVNAGQVGSRVPYADSRRIEVSVAGTAPIDAINIVRNGVAILRRDFLGDAASPPGGDGDYRIEFRSGAAPFQPGDAPRGFRRWHGALHVRGATLVQVADVGFANSDAQSLHVDGNSVRFRTLTRGNTSAIDLRLVDVRPDASVSIEIEAASESGWSPPRLRAHAQIPQAALSLPLRDLVGGLLDRPLSVDGYDDGVSLRRLRADAERAVHVEHVDATAPRHGDHYFVHVRQADGAEAWISPIWVGGYPHN